jgi:primosomal protein N''
LGKEELEKASLDEIVENQQKIAALKSEIDKLKSRISKCRQFKEKVELNIVLKMREQELSKLI